MSICRPLSLLILLIAFTAGCGSGQTEEESTAFGVSQYAAGQPPGDQEAEVVSVAEDPGSETADGQDEQSNRDRDNNGDQENDGEGDEGGLQGADSPDIEPPDTLPLPKSADELTEALGQAELAVRDPMIQPAIRAAWGRRQQALYRHLGNNDSWAPTVLAEADETVRAAVELNWTARQSLAALLNTEELHSELPAWRVAEPAPADELIGYYKQGEAAWGIPWEFLAGINLIETRMGRIQGVSTAGAVGPMQFLPTTWAECCDGDPTDPADAIVGAAKYLTIRGGPENMDRAIWGYNNSDYYVAAVTAYANVLMADERAYHGYHAWEIYFLSTEGLIRIPVGYEQAEPVAATDWLAENPDTLFSR